jgi:hypothetical protein
MEEYIYAVWIGTAPGEPDNPQVYSQRVAAFVGYVDAREYIKRQTHKFIRYYHLSKYGKEFRHIEANGEWDYSTSHTLTHWLDYFEALAQARIDQGERA